MSNECSQLIEMLQINAEQAVPSLPKLFSGEYCSGKSYPPKDNLSFPLNVWVKAKDTNLTTFTSVYIPHGMEFILKTKKGETVSFLAPKLFLD